MQKKSEYSIFLKTVLLSKNWYKLFECIMKIVCVLFRIVSTDTKRYKIWLCNLMQYPILE